MSNKLFFIPSLFTVLNLFLGFLSIVMSAEGHYELAAWLINFAVLCDGMDGKIARWTQTETTYGYELDSIADVISFGAAPSLLVYLAFTEHLLFSVIGLVFSFLFLFAGAFRLARFNVQAAAEHMDGYQGLPIPVAAMTLASLVIFKFESVVMFDPILWSGVQLFLSLLMISGIPYQWPQLMFHGTFKDQSVSVLICIIILFMAFLPRYFLFPLLGIYVVKGFVSAIVALFQKEDVDHWLSGKSSL